MKAITVTATVPQPQVVWQGVDATVHFSEQETVRTLEDGTTQTEYVYTAVIVRDAKKYADVVSAAKKAARDYEIAMMSAETQDGDPVGFNKGSQADITTVISIALAEWMTAVSDGATPQAAATAVLSQVTVWKCHDNAFRELSFADFLEAAKKGGTAQTGLYMKYA